MLCDVNKGWKEQVGYREIDRCEQHHPRNKRIFALDLAARLQVTMMMFSFFSPKEREGSESLPSYFVPTISEDRMPVTF